jgi:hypothetical protein
MINLLRVLEELFSGGYINLKQAEVGARPVQILDWLQGSGSSDNTVTSREHGRYQAATKARGGTFQSE